MSMRRSCSGFNRHGRIVPAVTWELAATGSFRPERRIRWCDIPLRIVTALVVSAILIGCGGTDNDPTHQVNGVLHYNGEPLSNVGVTFYPEHGRSAVGKTNAEGNFTLMTYNPNDGAVAGEHKVAIVPGPGDSAAKDSSELTADDYAPPASGNAEAPFPRKYLSRETTDLTVHIPDDLENGQLKLELSD